MTRFPFNEANAGNSRGRIGLGPRGLTAESGPPPFGEYDGGGDAGTPKSIRFSLAGPIVEDVVLESLMAARTSPSFPLRKSRLVARGCLRTASRKWRSCLSKQRRSLRLEV